MSNTDTGDTLLNPSGNPRTTTTHESAILRESLITTAVSFLHNDNVQRSPITQKQKFLQSKGLNENEIQVAFERAGVFTNDPNNTVINLGINSSQAQHSKNLVIQQQHMFIPSTLTKIKDILSSAAVISSLLYAVYTVYKRFIEPFLFGRKKGPTIVETLERIDTKVETQIGQVNSEIIRIREEIQANNQNDNVSRELMNFKNDLDAIKGLLLNRKQFASGGYSTMIPTSIPAWQLTSQQHHSNDPDKNEDADGSASNSSETEVVVKNSDSSIEIM